MVKTHSAPLPLVQHRPLDHSYHTAAAGCHRQKYAAIVYLIFSSHSQYTGVTFDLGLFLSFFAALLDHFPRLILFIPLAVGVFFRHRTDLDQYPGPFTYSLSSNLERCRLSMCVNVTYVAYGA